MNRAELSFLDTINDLRDRVAYLEAHGTPRAGSGNGFDSDTVDSIHAATTATASQLLALDADKDLHLDTGDVSATDGTLTGGLNVGPVSGACEGNIITYDEVQAGGDAAGCNMRYHGLGFPAWPTFPFGGEDLSAWAWAGAPFVTPAAASQSNSQLCIGHTGATDPRAFYYLTDALDSRRYILLTLNLLDPTSYCGLRLDDGSDSNYVEIALRRTSAAQTNEVITRKRSGGGAVTVAVELTGFFPGQRVALSNQVNDTKYSNWTFVPIFGIDAGLTFGANLTGLAWTPTRRGITWFHKHIIPSTWQNALIDAYT